MLLTLLGQRGARRLLSDARRSRRKRCPRCFCTALRSCAGADIDHIHDSIPLTAKLADLFVRPLEQHRDRVLLPGNLGMHGWKIEPPARNRVEDAHQCALRVAIADVKKLHDSCPLVAPASRRLSGGHPGRRSCTTILIRPRKPFLTTPLPPEPSGNNCPRG